MPSIAAHMVVAKLVAEKLKIKDPDFIKGNLLPDIIAKKDSHHKIKGKYFYIPGLDYFKDNLDFNNSLNLGYYVHLLLDKYFLEEFVLENISNLDVFKNKIIYNEYNKINYQLVRKFELDVESLKEVLKKFEVSIDTDKLNYNLECLSIVDVGETTYLKFQDFSNFLYNISQVISKEIEDYAGKSSGLFLRFRK